jgi:GNAT superfamily N-acetyltransferase/uncharacterized glyoxalase superfamily protein PhnB
MRFSRITPILYSSDVAKSIDYYINVLQFDNHWTWDDPATFGGVSKNAVDIFFCKECQGSPGTWLAIMVDNVDNYYESIKAKGADIPYPPETKEWGLREMLVKDPDGHIIRFGQPASHKRKEGEAAPEDTYRIVDRMPTTEEYARLMHSVGWGDSTGAHLHEVSLAAAVHAVVAEEIATGNVIGCALALADRASFYYVKDVMVHPDWQCKGVGTAVMRQLTNWIETNAPNKALVGLFTGENLSRFYQQFGFRPSYGMSFRVTKPPSGLD